MSNFPDAHKVYELAAVFRERVIEQGRSFLWPDHEIWTIENAQKLLSIESQLVKPDTEVTLQQTADSIYASDSSLCMLAADAQAVCHFFWASTLEIMQKHLGSFLNQPGVPEVDRDTYALLADQAGNSVPGSWMIYKQTGITWHLSAVATIAALRGNQNRLQDTAAIEQALIGLDQPGMWYHHIWNIAHVLYPDEIVSLSNDDAKRLVIKRYGTEAGVDPSAGELTQLHMIKEYLAPRLGDDLFDFFHPSIYFDWENRETQISKWFYYERGGPIPDEIRKMRAGVSAEEHISPPLISPSNDDNQMSAIPSIIDLATATHLDEFFLSEVETLLSDKKQMIFEGPPGSGKTFVAEKFARYFVGMPLDEETDEDSQIELVQFHQSYSYEDFVEGIRPHTNDAGQLVYDVTPGIFREFAAKAAANPDKKFVLIIDEINRGNVSRILGELMLLLEYRHKSAKLPYSKELLSIPPNLFIIGTMNSADRSLSQIDYALRRRFHFVRFMSVESGTAKVLSRWLATESNDNEANRRTVEAFVRLNQKLSARLGTDDLQVGHSYFMRRDIHEKATQQMVWTYSVLPLLREYLYHDRERDQILATFSLESILSELIPAASQDEIGEPGFDS